MIIIYNGSNSNIIILVLDAGYRIPKGIHKINFRDWGNYDQCLGINSQINNVHIEGKYCPIQLPLQQNAYKLSQIELWQDIISWIETLDEQTRKYLSEMEWMKSQISMISREDTVTR